MTTDNDLIDCTDIDSLENSIKDVFNDIILKLKSKDENFIQGVSRFVQRYNKLREGSETCTTIPRIASALHTFATRHLNSYKKTTKMRLGKRIKVQSTAAGRRRPGISRGMKKTQPGRPPNDFKRKIDEAEGRDSDDFDRFRFRVRKMSKVKKRKHDLSSNIAKNQQNSGKW